MRHEPMQQAGYDDYGYGSLIACCNRNCRKTSTLDAKVKAKMLCYAKHIILSQKM